MFVSETSSSKQTKTVLPKSKREAAGPKPIEVGTTAAQAVDETVQDPGDNCCPLFPVLQS